MRRTALLLGLALTAACAAPVEDDPPPVTTAPIAPAAPAAPAAPPVPGITAEAVQLRTDAAIGGQVHVRITATGDAPFTVTELALDSPGFSPVPAAPVTAEFAPGRVIDLPAPYGDPLCSAGALPAAARLGVLRPDGTTERLRVPLEAPVLGQIHEAECVVLGLAEVVDIAVHGLHDDGDALTGELVLTRRGGDEPVSLARVGRSVLVDVAVDRLPLELHGDRAATAVSFTPASCDPHVLSETKQPYRFALLVTVGEDEPVAMDLPLDDGDRDLLAALVERVCAARE